MKKRNLRKWVIYLMITVNLLIIATVGNNAILTDLCLTALFGFNCSMLLKYDHKYIMDGNDYE